jgi:hypothetical protein
VLDGLKARPAAPFDLGFVHRQLQFGPAPEQGLQRTRSLDARQLMAKAKVNSGAEGDMPVRLSREIKLLRRGFACGSRFAAASMG